MAVAIRPTRDYRAHPYYYYYGGLSMLRGVSARPRVFKQPPASHIMIHYPDATFMTTMHPVGVKWNATLETQLKRARERKDNMEFQLNRTEKDILEAHVLLEEIKRKPWSRSKKSSRRSQVNALLRKLEANKARYHREWQTQKRRVQTLEDVKTRSRRGGGGGGGGGRGVRAKQRVAVPVRR